MILATILIILSGICNAIQDTLQFHYYNSIFLKLNPLFWNPEFSWRNKYKKGWLFQTWLVFTTDAWHLFKTLSKLFMLSGFTYAWLYVQFNVFYLLILLVADEIGFTPFYKYILIKR